MRNSNHFVFLLSAALGSLIPNPSSAQVVEGKILDAEGTRLPYATLALLGVNGDTVSITQADSAGAFYLTRLRTGDYWLVADQMGYEAIQTYVHLSEGDHLEVEIRLEVDAILLDALTVTASRRPWWESLAPPGLWEFYERRDHYSRLGMGSFLTYRDLKPLQGLPVALAVADMTPFLTAVAVDGPRASYRLQARRGCSPVLFLDGAPLRGGEIEEFISLSFISGIEVYRGASDVPGEFRIPGSNCGAVAIWTQRGPRVG